MSDRAVGAHWLREMEIEERVTKLPRDVYVAWFGTQIAEELRVMPRPGWNDAFRCGSIEYERVTRLWQKMREQNMAEINARYDKRVVAWGNAAIKRGGGPLEPITARNERLRLRGRCECIIGDAHREALQMDFVRTLERELTVEEAA